EYREGKGMVLFCQLDVTARSITDPVAETVVRSIMRYVSERRPRPRRRVLYAGKPAGKRHLDASGFSPTPFAGGALSPDQVLVVGSDGEKVLSRNKGSVAAFLKAGGNLLALGLDEEQANGFLPWRVEMTRAEHIASVFKAPGTGSLLAGVGSPDVHNRDPHELPLVTSGAAVAGNGILAAARDANVVFYQLPPYELTRAQGAIPSLVTTTEDAPEGKRCALATMGTTTGRDSHLGQKTQRAGQRGKTYTFAALVRAVGEPVRLHLELERAGKPWDRVVKAKDVVVGPDQWTEIHATFKVTKGYPEGWQGYIACRQDGAQFKADRFRLYEGAYVPWQRGGAKLKERPNLFAKAGFEEGVGKPWSFSYQVNRNLRRTYRRSSFTLNRLLANMGAGATTPLLANLSTPPGGKGQATANPLIKNADLGLDGDQNGIADSWGCSLTGDGATRGREEIEPGSGKWSQRLSCPRPDAKGKSGAMLYQLGVPVIGDQWYRISLLAKSEGMDGTAPTLAISQTGPWQSLLPYQKFLPERDWKRFTFVLKGKSTEAKKTRLQIWHSGTGTVWYADIRMQAIAPPDQGRWLESYYVDVPEDWDDPYRFFRW
ncbi:MAG: hypothetical protein HN849_03385, partial [Victivallales bacterium]|nr:hypothetical protein [Victivallales bacterium]